MHALSIQHSLAHRAPPNKMKNTSTSIMFLSILLFISLSSPLLAKESKCNRKDQEAIQEIRAAFGLEPIADCCDWDPVVTCRPVTGRQAGNRVINLFFANCKSNVSRQIPPAVAKLSRLQALTLSSCNFYGPIPTFLLKLKKLAQLDLSFNSLTGSIPPELSQLSKLQTLDLEGNKLTGTIPESLGHFTASPLYLILSQNQLTGTVRKSLANLPFANLDLSNNKLTGDPTFLFQNNTVIQDLSLSRNLFSFNFSNVVIPANLRGVFNVSHNNIFGEIPQQLTQVDFVEGALDVSYNQLCGPIPQGGNLQDIPIESYSHNKCLCDAPLPPCK